MRPVRQTGHASSDDRPIQYFSEDYLRQCSEMAPEQIVTFLDQFRLLHAKAGKSKSRLISMKVDETLLETFRTQSQLRGVPYQTQIKRLMREWLR
jgi:predicted DNA binding CopG/RHH family protein